MKDPRFDKLASLLVSHSTKVKKSERALIEAFDVPEEMVIALVRAVRAAGGIPYVNLRSGTVDRELVAGGTEAQWEFHKKVELSRMKGMDVYFSLRGSHNIFEKSNVPGGRSNLEARVMRPVLNWRVSKTKWVVLRWPTPSMAQSAGMATEEFEDFYFRVCTLDYGRMVPGMNALKRLMERTDKVQIKGPGTELSFSIKGIGAVCCGGGHNIPDGEVFTAPVKNSVEGTISYNTSTVYQGSEFHNVELRFEKGKVVDARSQSNTGRLNQILNADAGARYIGEFAIGFNPHILSPMNDILFDEKIAGSFHFTPGQAYADADNGNRSQVHWDMVCIQRKEWGGGEIYFDGKLIRKDGLFVGRELSRLNPDYLTKAE